MTTALVKSGMTVPEAYTSDWVDLVKRTVCDGASDPELQLFLYQCKKTGLDPLAKQIYLQRRWNKAKNRHDIAIITGIDGYRLTAQRTGEYAGNDDAIYDNEEAPRKATVTVYRIVAGVRCPFTASARWDQYYPGDQLGFMWRKMPHLMLGKCAEGLALRKAFPQELSGIYVPEEMAQAGPAEGEVIEHIEAPLSVPKKEEIYEIPFGMATQEAYTETPAQKKLLQRAAAKVGIRHPVNLAVISKNTIGVPVDDIDGYVASWVAKNPGELSNEEQPK